MPKPKDKNKNPKQIILKEKEPKVIPILKFTIRFYISILKPKKKKNKETSEQIKMNHALDICHNIQVSDIICLELNIQ